MKQRTQATFNDRYRGTIGAEFELSKFKIDGKLFSVQIWDTEGNEKFKSISSSYQKDSTCAMIVYDITRRDTFESVASLLQELRQFQNDKLLILLVGNKLDLEGDRKVETQEGKAFAAKNGLVFYEVSSKTGYNVNEVFEESVAMIWNNINNKVYDLSQFVYGIKVGRLESEIDD